MKNIIKKLFFILTPLGFLTLLVLSIIHSNKDDFWDIGAYDILILLLTSLFALLGYNITMSVTEKNNDKRRFVDEIVRFIHLTNNLIESEKLIPIIDDGECSKDNQNSILMYKRRLSNYIEVISKYAENLMIQEEINFIKNKFNEYGTIIEVCFNQNTMINENNIMKISNCVLQIYDKFNEVEIKLYSNRIINNNKKIKK